MKIAVTYDNGQIFQHFGHSAQFKLSEVSGGMILNTALPMPPCWPCWQASLAMTPMCAAPTMMKRTVRAATPAAAMAAETTAATDGHAPSTAPPSGVRCTL